MASSRSISVLFLSVVGELGGAERSLLELLPTLPKSIRPHAAAPPDTPLAEELYRAGIEVHPLPAMRLQRTLNPLLVYKQTRTLQRCGAAIANLCAEHGIQTIHANTDIAALAAWRGAKSTGLPYVWQCRDITRSRAVTKILGESAAKVIAISAAVEGHLRAMGVPAKKIQRVMNGIGLDRFQFADRDKVRSRMRSKLKVNAEQVLLLSVGGFVPWKRHEDFLQLMATLRARGLSVIGGIVGSDLFKQNVAYEKRLREQAAQLPHGTVQFLGQRNDVPELLTSADIVVSCSASEPFGRVLAEAGAAGVPVVTTDSGGKAEIVAAGRTGLVVPHGDVAGLAEACARLVVNPALRARMGAAAREHVAANFNIARVAAQIAALHQELVS